MMDDANDEHWKLPPDSRRSKPELVADKLSDLIDSGLVARGEPLPSEGVLADRFGVGRSSVRTGLQRLQSRGRVEVAHGVGWRVTAQPAEPLSGNGGAANLVEVQVGLETTAARLAARNATDPQVRAVIAANDLHLTAIRKHDVDAMVETDERFHRCVVEAADNDVLTDMYDLLAPRLVAHRRAYFDQGPEAARRSVSEHALIVQFLRHGDPSGAAVAMESHIRAFGTA